MPPATFPLSPTATGLSQRLPCTWRPVPRALISLVESETGTLDEAYAENTLRDARNAGWRADLAVRQISD
ncbi:MAG TPA: hypothetical protein VKA82_17340 [Rubrobacter sp.]|nr:hypothetical protein [Rubrobacter sp.]